MRDVTQRVIQDATALADGGFDAVLVENYGDAPFFPDSVPAVTIAAMATLASQVRTSVAVPVGINVLRNDTPSAIAIAAVADLAFVRSNVHTGMMVTDQGPLVGRAHKSLRLRDSLGHPVAIFADVMVKHATPPPGLTLEQAASDCWERGRPEALIVTGAGTGSGVEVADIGRVRSAAPGAPIYLGSGLTPDTVGLLGQVDGAFVGSFLKRDGVAGGPVDPDRVRSFMDATRRLDQTR